MEDLEFLHIMDAEFHQDSSKSWVGPLPFRSPRQRLPNNRRQAHDRLLSLRRTLEKRPQMKAHFLEFMQNMLSRGSGGEGEPLQKLWCRGVLRKTSPKEGKEGVAMGTWSRE